MLILALSLMALMTSVISGVIGMGGGIVLLSLMTFFVPWSVLIPVHGVVQLVSNSSRCYFLRHKIAYRIFVPFIIGAPFGILLATFLVGMLSDPQLPMLLVLALIVYVLFKPKKLPPLIIPEWAFGLLGFVSGFLAMMIGATGPLLAPFFLRKDLQKEEIVATKAACQMVGHFLKLPAFFYLGFNYQENLLLIGSMCMAALLGTRLGVYILGHLNDQFFRWLYKIALAFAATRILYNLYF